MIDAALLIHLNPRLSLATAEELAPPLAEGADTYAINTLRRVAAFLGQAAHESAGFTTMEEDLHYRPATLLRMWPYDAHRRPWGFTEMQDAEDVVAGGLRAIGNRIYGTRLGNRPGTDDGYNLRGSGLMQITGRDAFTLYENAAADQLVANPDELRQLPHAARSAAWVFGVFKKCNELADRWEIEIIGGRINGKTPPYGAEERLKLCTRALNWLGGS